MPLAVVEQLVAEMPLAVVEQQVAGWLQVAEEPMAAGEPLAVGEQQVAVQRVAVRRAWQGGRDGQDRFRP